MTETTWIVLILAIVLAWKAPSLKRAIGSRRQRATLRKVRRAARREANARRRELANQEVRERAKRAIREIHDRDRAHRRRRGR